MEKNTVNNAKRKKAKGDRPVRKPYLNGQVYSASALARSGKVLLYYVVYLFFFLVVGAALSFDNVVLNIAMNAGAIVATIGMTYMEGLKHGDTDVSVGEILYQRKENGRTLERIDLERAYHPVKGVLTALVGVSPFLLITLVYALCAEPQYYTLGVLPGWVETVTAEEVQLPLAYYDREYAFGVVDLFRILSRLSLMPYINIVNAENVQGLYMVDVLGPVLILLPALGYLCGYLRGPVSRAYTHGSIAANHRKQKRKQQKEQKARQRQTKQII